MDLNIFKWIYIHTNPSKSILTNVLFVGGFKWTYMYIDPFTRPRQHNSLLHMKGAPVSPEEYLDMEGMLLSASESFAKLII